jgi:hypothetical protein
MLGTGWLPARAQAVYGDPQAPVAGTVLGTVMHTQDAEEWRYVILQRLTDQYADAQGIVVTPAEQEAYITHVQEALQRDRVRQEARRDALTRQLADSGLSQAERASLAAELDTVRQGLTALAEPTGTPAEVQAARAQIAVAFIRQWKINRALYQQYGGRIIFQQGGPEPLDAYRRFLEERQVQGDWTIVNPALQAAFWRYYVTDTLHVFYPPGSKEEAQVFATPPWLAHQR